MKFEKKKEKKNISPQGRLRYPRVTRGELLSIVGQSKVEKYYLVVEIVFGHENKIEVS